MLALLFYSLCVGIKRCASAYFVGCTSFLAFLEFVDVYVLAVLDFLAVRDVRAVCASPRHTSEKVCLLRHTFQKKMTVICTFDNI